MRISSIIKTILIILLLAYLAYYIATNIEEFYKLRSISTPELLLMVLVLCIYCLVAGYRMFVLLLEFGLNNIRYLAWVKIFIMALFFNKFLPQSGNVYRAVKLKEAFGFNYNNYLAMLSVFVWFDALTMLLILSVSFFVFEKSLLYMGLPVYFLTIIVLLLTVMLPVLLSKVLRDKIKKPAKIAAMANSFCDGLDKMKSVPLLLKQVFLSVFGFSLYVLAMFLCAKSINIEVSTTILIIYSAVIKLSTYIVIIPGNIGIKEIILGYLSLSANLDFGDGIIIAGISRLIAYISIIIMGSIFGGLPLLKDLRTIRDKGKMNAIK